MMKMMKFTKVMDDINEALFQFCAEQASMNSYVSEEEIDVLTESAVAVLGKLSDASLRVIPMYRYHIYAGEQFTDEIFPDSIKENGILYDRAIHLGTFLLDTYSDVCAKEMKAILRGYDVIYDLESGEIKLLYRIMTEDDSLTTIYCCDTDLYEDFDVYEFVIDLTAQISTKLKQSLSAVYCGKAAA